MIRSEGQYHVAFLRGVMMSGGRIERANFSLLPEPTFYLTLIQNGVRTLLQFAWTADLEKYLFFELHQRIESQNEEAERFAAILLNNLATVEQDIGDRYIPDIVLLEILRDREQYDLKSILDQIQVPYWREMNVSGAHPNITDFLKRSIDGLHNQAVLVLRYSDAEALELMRAALRIVLDRTWHIPRQPKVTK